MYNPFFTTGFSRALAAGEHDQYLAQRLSPVPNSPELSTNLVAALVECAHAGCLEDYDPDILLNGGPPGSYTLGQVRNALLPPVNLTTGDVHETILERLQKLIMPAFYMHANPGSVSPLEAYIELFGLTDLNDTAYDLEQLSRSSREGVEQLLVLNFEHGRELILAAQPVGVSASALDDIFKQVLSVEALHMHVRWALECSAVLHCPFAWSGLDRADLHDMLRYGPVHRQIMQDLRLLERVIRNYQKGIKGGEPELDHELRDMGLEARAQAVLAIWEQNLGPGLPSLLDDELRIIEAAIKTMRKEMEEVAPPHVRFTRRIANWKEGYEPLVLFGHLTRLVVAWVAEAPYKKGVDQLLDWISAGYKRADFSPNLKVFVPRQNALAAEAFTLLRYVVIEDDNMIPHKLRSLQDKNGATIQLQSQADSVRHRRERFTLEELLGAAYKEGRKYSVDVKDKHGNIVKVEKRSAPVQRVDILKKLKLKNCKRPVDLDEPTRSMFASGYQKLAGTAHRLL